MARYLGVAITFLCFCLLGSGHFPAVASDAIHRRRSATRAHRERYPAPVPLVSRPQPACCPLRRRHCEGRSGHVARSDLDGKRPCRRRGYPGNPGQVRRRKAEGRGRKRLRPGKRRRTDNAGERQEGEVRRARRGADQIGGRNRLDGPPDTSQTRTALRWRAAAGMVWQGTEVTRVPRPVLGSKRVSSGWNIRTRFIWVGDDGVGGMLRRQGGTTLGPPY